MKSSIKIIPLGGVREDGKNLYAIEINDGIYILDCGLKYPDNGMLGIDVVIPDFSYLEDNKDKIVGIFLSNGQADSIGALPYFLSKFNVPVFGSKLTIELAKNAINENPNSRSFDDYNVINSKSEIIFDDVTVTFFKTSYSIPDSMGIVLSVDDGQIVYTGDFKFDPALKGKYKTAYGDIARVGDKNVIALLSDSGNADNPYPMDSELKVEKYIFDVFKDNDERIIVAANSANILRLQQVFDAAYKSNRKIYIGHDLSKKVITALDMGYLVLPDKDMIIQSVKEMNDLSKNEIVILETNPVGEPIKVIQRMASQKEKSVNLIPGDIVLITTTPSPALDNTMAKTRDMVYRADGEVKTISDDLNISNHASDEDLQMLIDLLNPEYVIPVGGEYMMMEAHRQTANELGIDNQHILLMNKGDVAEYDGSKMHRGSSVEAGNTMIDGIGIGDIGNIVLRDRKVLSEDGIFIIVVTIDRKKKLIISRPKITSRGFIYVKSNKELMNEASQIVSKTIQLNLDNKEFDWSHLKQAVREQISHFLFDKTKRRPVILPVIMEVNQHHRKNKHSFKKHSNESKK
ncbi:ribonuclease J [Apilactobacillus timberlakei]|uniref:ribonuclease J n=1 Tax=Apilactobacillus timberlakei TaxID=2008380 RepID=UPI001127068F|nr:ribonuclease J [Apilactobacillus timberlakei]TPR17409.1 ribonuclease J [Apilactobacillus timberlakei]TPR19934.1 ribonuclease J [Apilactobacillus timberlakei]TPR21651.1 ribonuclease J [Apilactobacillus timberlakei]TPR22897.1 ribonuclease J [Apilactobacillus timberlakei]TPR23901.1 ribonuclease J [Apilactobacillus timberlakei]